MFSLYGPAVLVAFLITLLEMTEVVALVFALSAEHHTIAHGAWGAIGGTATVAVLALGFGALLIALPQDYLLSASAIVLLGFGLFLFRSTLRTCRRARGLAPAKLSHGAGNAAAVQFAGGFSVGMVEATEAVIVLLALAAAGYGASAIVGALTAGLGLVIATAIVQERIRKIKVPWLKLGATALLLSFAVFWGGQALGYAWPGSDLALLPLFLLFALVVRGAIALGLRTTVPPPAAS